MDSIAACKAALADIRDRRNNAVAIYELADRADPTPAKTPIAEMLNAGYPVRIPYRRIETGAAEKD